jgi:hypothetical protein
VQENEEPRKIEKQTYEFLHIPQYEKTKGYFFKPRRLWLKNVNQMNFDCDRKNVSRIPLSE